MVYKFATTPGTFKQVRACIFGVLIKIMFMVYLHSNLIGVTYVKDIISLVEQKFEDLRQKKQKTNSLQNTTRKTKESNTNPTKTCKSQLFRKQKQVT